MTLHTLRIIGLFEGDDIEFDLRRSPIFLIGPNGVGKTTCLKILYYIFTAQWAKIATVQFIGLELKTTESSFFIERQEFTSFSFIRNSLGIIARRQRNNQMWPDDWKSAEKLIQQRATSRRISKERLAEIALIYQNLAYLNNFVERETKNKVLYFPTYRRVERDLRELLGVTDEDGEEHDETADVRQAIQSRFERYGEVVGFGGQDIHSLITETADRIEQQARQALNEHSIRFLETLAVRTSGDTKAMRRFVLGEGNIDRLIKRIEGLSVKGIDTAGVKRTLYRLEEKLKSREQGRMKQQEDMLLYYLDELRRLFDTVDQLSFPLRNFTRIINKYLAPIKMADFDEADNTIQVMDKLGNEIGFEELSSGEKQILAFFAFLVLPKNSRI